MHSNKMPIRGHKAAPLLDKMLSNSSAPLHHHTHFHVYIITIRIIIIIRFLTFIKKMLIFFLRKHKLYI